MQYPAIRLGLMRNVQVSENQLYRNDQYQVQAVAHVES